MHFTKLAEARISKARSAWHTRQGCLNDCFHFAMQGLLQAFECFCFFGKRWELQSSERFQARTLLCAKF